MKNFNNTIEQEIRKQLEEREIIPSRDLWSEIEVQSAEKKSTANINWFLVAACLVLTFSLGVILFFNKENKQDENPETVAEIRIPAVQNKTGQPSVNPSEFLNQNPKKSITVEKPSPEKKEKSLPSQLTVERKDLLLNKESTQAIIANISKREPEKIFVQSDSVKISGKKKRYVDPSTLLFSVEHKDAIQKSKGKSNVASIEISGN